jgi:hypothetical protein
VSIDALENPALAPTYQPESAAVAQGAAATPYNNPAITTILAAFIESPEIVYAAN